MTEEISSDFNVVVRGSSRSALHHALSLIGLHYSRIMGWQLGPDGELELLWHLESPSAHALLVETPPVDLIDTVTAWLNKMRVIPGSPYASEDGMPGFELKSITSGWKYTACSIKTCKLHIGK